MDKQRCSGILCHPTSLPGEFGLGDLGPGAEAFVEFLARAGQSLWQILPLGPTGYGHSPYSSFSAFAGNPLLISLDRLVDAGDLLPAELEPYRTRHSAADFKLAAACRDQLLPSAARRFFGRQSERQQAFHQFCQEQAAWLEDFALFQALHRHFKARTWTQWPTELLHHDPAALDRYRHQHQEDLQLHRYIQFVFFEQWFALKTYANQNGVRIFGDLPIFVAHDSAEVWGNQALFRLDGEGQPIVVAGVPPDYFSDTGQRWGNPLYDWQVMAEDRYAWWRSRLEWNLKLADLVRIDHFRGFEACWEIPAGEPTAVNGRWTPAPGRELFAMLSGEFGSLPVVAEDLGVITPEVEALRDDCNFPGMKILQFAFDSGPDNPYLPHNHTGNCVVYPGTHDNNTALGWWQELTAAGKDQVRNYLGHDCRQMPWDLLRIALASVADICILPLQDILELPAAARMNRPGVATGNWEWRCKAADLAAPLADQLREQTHRYGRLLKATV